MTTADLDLPCDWDELCTATFNTTEEREAHSRDHWEREDVLNAHLRSDGGMTQTRHVRGGEGSN